MPCLHTAEQEIYLVMDTLLVFVCKGHVLQNLVLPGVMKELSFLSVNAFHNAWKVL